MSDRIAYAIHQPDNTVFFFSSIPTKQIILTGTVLLAVVAAVQAQNTSTVSQMGNSQTTDVQQKGAGNQSVIEQRTGTSSVTNEGNKATTFQQGNGSGQSNQGAVFGQSSQATIRQSNGSALQPGHH